jgi:hypothetical protein
MNIIKLLSQQSDVYKSRLEKSLVSSTIDADIYKAHTTAVVEFYNHAFKPTVELKKLDVFNAGYTKDVIDSLATDMSVAYSQLNNVSEAIQESYNSNQDYKTSIKNRVSALSSIVSDVNLIGGDDSQLSVTFRDSLSNYDFIDKGMSTGTISNISTSEGVAYLALKSNENITSSIEKVTISGNGTIGNSNIVSRVNIKSISEDYDIYAKYVSEDNSHSNLNTVIDSEANTWIEYQRLGFDNKFIQCKYDTEWNEAKKVGDSLYLTIKLKLKSPEELNWIDITPYIPEKSRSRVNIYSIKVSKDGSIFTPIFKDYDIINKDIHTIPQIYNSLVSSEYTPIAKFASQGIFNFASTVAQYIEIILKQEQPYNELLGHTYYTEVNGEISNIVPKQNVTEDIINGPIGKYSKDGKSIIKSIFIVDGWRYSIGLRGIDIYNKSFEQTSEFITTEFVTQQPIKKVMLYANEIIPNEYDSFGLEHRNKWIKYYISIDDINWYPISPSHHNQLGDYKIAPKIYEINSLSNSEEKINSVNKGYITSNGQVNKVRLKVIFERPSTMEKSTPILEEYSLRCILGGK